MHPSSIRSALASVFRISPRSLPVHQHVQNARRSTPSDASITRSFSTSPIRTAKKKAAKPDKRITMIRYYLHHPTTLMPRPLRFSRNRALRHWTIHRAWNLFRASIGKSRQLELERQYNAMREANEELRIGAGDGGKLFRKAQMKTGVWSIPERGGGVPIEYARGMMDWMGTKAIMGGEAKIWDHAWKRS